MNMNETQLRYLDGIVKVTSILPIETKSDEYLVELIRKLVEEIKNQDMREDV